MWGWGGSCWPAGALDFLFFFSLPSPVLCRPVNCVLLRLDWPWGGLQLLPVILSQKAAATGGRGGGGGGGRLEYWKRQTTSICCLNCAICWNAPLGSFRDRGVSHCCPSVVFCSLNGVTKMTLAMTFKISKDANQRAQIWLNFPLSLQGRQVIDVRVAPINLKKRS